ncbi:MAG: hypothetical protein WBG08_08365 [Litorimonas sp.]
MSLAVYIALLAMLLFGLSQYQRRAAAAPAWLPSMITGLAVLILGLVAYYLYGEFAS